MQDYEEDHLIPMNLGGHLPILAISGQSRETALGNGARTGRVVWGKLGAEVCAPALSRLTWSDQTSISY